MVKCEIKFDQNPLRVFYSGSTIKGKVEILLDKPMKVRDIALILSGKGKVYWTETEEHGDAENKVTTVISYTADENYLYTGINLCSSSHDDTVVIENGFHTYNFSCHLPPQLPSSIEGLYGHIRYKAKITFNRPWKFDKTFVVGFTVIKATDLNNEHPSIRLPSTLEVQKQFCCWPCTSIPLIIEVTIPQSGYVSGQYIPIKINLFNESGRQIKHLSVSIKKYIKFTSDYPCRKTQNQILNVQKMFIKSIQNLKREEINTKLLVPAVPPTTTIRTCRIIQVSYQINIKTYIKGPHYNKVVRIPIIIGTIPLRNVQISNNAPSATSSNSSSTENQHISAMEFNLPPPTYEEAVYQKSINMNDGEAHSICESMYIPRYPFFNFNPSTSAQDLLLSEKQPSTSAEQSSTSAQQPGNKS